MKVDEEIRKKLVVNLKDWRDDLLEMINEKIKEIEKAETVEKIMDIKKNLLLTLLDNLPLSSDLCYFCLKYDPEEGEERCNECEYGKVHGICLQILSDFDLIRRARDLLEFLIEAKYYSGEKYD